MCIRDSSHGYSFVEWAKWANKNQAIQTPEWLQAAIKFPMPSWPTRDPSIALKNLSFKTDQMVNAYYRKFPTDRLKYSLYPHRFDHVYTHPMKRFVARWQDLLKKGVPKKKAYKIAIKEREIEEHGKTLARELAVRQATHLFGKPEPTWQLEYAFQQNEYFEFLQEAEQTKKEKIIDKLDYWMLIKTRSILMNEWKLPAKSKPITLKDLEDNSISVNDIMEYLEKHPHFIIFFEPTMFLTGKIMPSKFIDLMSHGLVEGEPIPDIVNEKNMDLERLEDHMKATIKLLKRRTGGDIKKFMDTETVPEEIRSNFWHHQMRHVSNFNPLTPFSDRPGNKIATEEKFNFPTDIHKELNSLFGDLPKDNKQ
eukprot:TRINITY_DN150_c0_g2_i1.p1 TRINITY_DN150_c0_g2~~TRINITY_DN150_c0_g2_i1.p1  ORF type:complete len:366 (+),score=81.91 TRINITY_DN150_c0_g2_i1:1-1098(+)